MKMVLKALIRLYQVAISAPLHFLSGPLGGCRFVPSCSQYFLEALDEHGAWRGSLLGMRRILRCHPWGGEGYDPVPLAGERAPGADHGRCGCGGVAEEERAEQQSN
jgi:uncharacterized protein